MSHADKREEDTGKIIKKGSYRILIPRTWSEYNNTRIPKQKQYKWGTDVHRGQILPRKALRKEGWFDKSATEVR